MPCGSASLVRTVRLEQTSECEAKLTRRTATNPDPPTMTIPPLRPALANSLDERVRFEGLGLVLECVAQVVDALVGRVAAVTAVAAFSGL